MKYRQLGNSKLQVSEISLGSYLTYGDTVNESQSKKCIETALDHGINFFDTANSYAEGEAERVMGNALKPYARDRYIISTKCYFPRNPRNPIKGLSRENILVSAHESLSAMQLEYIDVLLAHRFDENTMIEETIDAFDSLIKKGHIRYWGVSRWSAEQMALAIECCTANNKAKPIENQYFYNMLNPVAEEIFPTCDREGIGVVAYSPLAQGVLTGKYLDEIPGNSRASDLDRQKSMWHLKPADLEKVRQLKSVAEAKGMKLNNMAIDWCLSKPTVSSVLIGASNPEQILDNLITTSCF